MRRSAHVPRTPPVAVLRTPARLSPIVASSTKGASSRASAPGCRRASLSKKHTNCEPHAATPRLRPPPTPRFSRLRITRTRGSSMCAGTSEPLSSTMTFTRTSCWSIAEATAAPRMSASFQVRMTTSIAFMTRPPRREGAIVLPTRRAARWLRLRRRQARGDRFPAQLRCTRARRRRPSRCRARDRRAGVHLARPLSRAALPERAPRPRVPRRLQVSRIARSTRCREARSLPALRC